MCTKPNHTDAIVLTSMLGKTISYLLCHSNWLIIIRPGGSRLTDTCVGTILTCRHNNWLKPMSSVLVSRLKCIQTFTEHNTTDLEVVDTHPQNWPVISGCELWPYWHL